MLVTPSLSPLRQRENSTSSGLRTPPIVFMGGTTGAEGGIEDTRLGFGRQTGYGGLLGLVGQLLLRFQARFFSVSDDGPVHGVVGRLADAAESGSGGQGSGSRRSGSGRGDGFGLGGDEDDSSENSGDSGRQRHGNEWETVSFLSLREVPLWLMFRHFP